MSSLFDMKRDETTGAARVGANDEFTTMNKGELAETPTPEKAPGSSAMEVDEDARVVCDTGDAESDANDEMPQSRPLEDSRESSSDSNDEGDRKPAAKPRKGEEEHTVDLEDDNEDLSSSSGSSDDDDDDDDDDDYNETKGVVTEDGRLLSEYEIQRLERIKRNRQYLAQLGLEGKQGVGVMRETKPNVSRAKKGAAKQKEVPVRRSSMSRRTKMKPVSYAEPSSSVRDLLRVVDGKIDAIGKKTRIATTVSSVVAHNEKKDDTGDQRVGPETTSERKKKGKNVNERLEHFIYLEFKRVKGAKNLTLRTAERNFRAAEKEVKYWSKLVTVWERRNERQKEAERQRQAEALQKEMFGGKSTKELLYEIDNRLPAIVQAIQRYDDSLEADQREQERKIKRLEAEHKLKTLDALDLFPKAMKNAVSLLNSVFLECAPKDPPPLRRSKRSAADDDQNEPPTPKERPTASVRNMRKSETQIDYDDIRLNSLKPTLDPPKENEGIANEKSASATQRRRVARNVGGWISPEFSKDIDRSWLESDAPAEKFDLSTYVPQIGDIVLYYISGHRQFIDNYPDVLGRKTRSKSRVPLWERAVQLQGECQSLDQSLEATWWTAEWLEGVKSSGDLGRYPLLCRVERAHAEFPPDPFSKVVKKDDKHAETKVYFKKPKGFSGVKGLGKTHMRLAVTLRPLTSLVAPVWNEAGPAEIPSLALPPLFTVVTFPCQLEPFVVPFAWGYATTHSLSLNQKVLIRSGDDTRVRIDGFMPLGGRDTMRLEDKIAVIERILAYYDGVSSKNAALEEELGIRHLNIPLRDARVVLDTWYRIGRRPATLETDLSSSEKSIGFVDLLRSTLPVWRSVAIMRNMYDRKKQMLSPWCLVPAGKGQESLSPWNFGKYSFRLEESLRVKMECLLEDFAVENPVVMEMFYHPVTEEVAPSYFCAVPVGTALVHILQRLQVKGRIGACYYRSVEAIIADVEALLNCCLLYNSPESDVVTEAARVVASAKDKIVQVAQEHYREMKEAREVDDERRLLVLRHCQFRTSAFDILRKPFKELLHRDWLDRMHREVGRLPTIPFADAISNDSDAGAFQAGDLVIYSRELHGRFVKGHYPSLESEQCIIPSSERVFGLASLVEDASAGNGSQVDNDWVQGEIIWARASFPRARSKQNGEDVNSFRSVAILQCLGVKFRHCEDVCVLYWRPCLFHFDLFFASGCPGCGLAPSSSFLRFDKTAPRDAFAEEPENQESEGGIAACMRQSIDRCINLLKRRCLRAVRPAYVDPLLTKDNVKSGYKPPTTKIGKKSLPMFDRLFSVTPDQNVVGNTQHGTRGILLKPKEDDADVALLVDAGFLPPWVSSISGGTADDGLLRKFEAILPTPKLSLELVQLRLRNGYYRQKAAIENDLVEAFLSTTVALLSEAASRKRSPISVKRVARFLATLPENTNEISLDADVEPTGEEISWAQKLRCIRALYATALVAVSDTISTERVFGLVSYSPPKLNTVFEMQDQDPFRVAARQKLAFLVSTLGRDECLNTYDGDGKPLLKLTIKCGGELVSCDGSVAPLLATLNDTSVKVNVVCEGHPVAFGNAFLSPPESEKPGVGFEKRSVTHCIYFGPEDCERNDSLARLLFRRPGRTGACARCQAYKRSMLACRVLKRHSNLDFDWVSVLSGGVDLVDDLLKVMDPGTPGKLETVEPGKDNDLDEQRAKHEDEGDGDELPADDCDSVDEGTLDPREFVKKAFSALQLSTEVLVEAKAFSETPARLSKDFIRNAFPIDLSDGHYMYCVVCGLSGDLLCCDGCPNVVHSHCVALSYLPDGDWFCEECWSESASKTTKLMAHGEENLKYGAMKPLSNGEQKSNRSISVETTKPAASAEEHSNGLGLVGGRLETMAEGNHQPFGRVEFDDGKIELVTTLLDELRNARPTHKVKRASIGGNHIEDGDGDGYNNDDDVMFINMDDVDDPFKKSSPTRKQGDWNGNESRIVDIKRSRQDKVVATWNDIIIEPIDDKSACGSHADIGLNHPGPRKRRRKSTDLPNVDAGQARGSSRKRKQAKIQASSRGEDSIASEAIPIAGRTMNGRRALSRDAELGPKAGRRNVHDDDHARPLPNRKVVRNIEKTSVSKIGAVGSQVLSVDSTSSVPRRNISSPRKSCPPVRFVDII